MSSLVILLLIFVVRRRVSRKMPSWIQDGGMIVVVWGVFMDVIFNIFKVPVPFSYYLAFGISLALGIRFVIVFRLMRRPHFAPPTAISYASTAIGFLSSLAGICLSMWYIGVNWSTQNLFPVFVSAFTQGFDENFTASYMNLTGQAFNISAIPAYSLTPSQISSLAIFNPILTYGYLVMCLAFMGVFLYGFMRVAQSSARTEANRLEHKR